MCHNIRMLIPAAEVWCHENSFGELSKCSEQLPDFDRTIDNPYIVLSQVFNLLRPRQNCGHFAANIFKCILLNENIWISIEISLKFVTKGPINIIPTLVQMMARHRPGNKPLSEPVMVGLPMHVCITRPQWLNWLHYDFQFSLQII